ncbi:MAG TPA: enoyl-CoA hydratase-related protein [Accumulibacter sp.]|uniref:enoyl-CoA hydratase-related protein n=1 Tax=Accumulibacter sp. TaxID=2053492 RepID=UPI0025D296CD|nr:enoyl-CoA hydratase-related protein [Accumulibacter sp.]MCM8597847.1 enoyl-CoA hydratase-related protein [Accumulibacter sp.]MCM8661891.1 enoyl-CoA hydratase-related protein [Accumulibacter sp.]HNC52009.1 enoyl-CoA hydratase-related protein [Accumulibacter sp.]HNF92191.1 enoyl-CoA hydratase-related protein [Accumulibacter sp.]
MNSLSVSQHDGVGHITLHRVGALNALSREFCQEIDAALRDLDNTEEIRAILVSSALRHFCAGADIREMAEMTAEEATASQFTGCVSVLPDIAKPVIVAVNGLAAGGGCEFVEMCDIVIAAATAKFCHPEISLGAMPGAGGTQRLSRAVGKHIAMDLLLTGRALSADEALAAGLVSRIAPDEQLEEVALAVARQVASFSGPVARRIKASVNDTQVNLEAGLIAERDRFHRCFKEHDFREGVSAFMEKRNAHFLHR